MKNMELTTHMKFTDQTFYTKTIQSDIEITNTSDPSFFLSEAGYIDEKTLIFQCIVSSNTSCTVNFWLWSSKHFVLVDINSCSINPRNPMKWGFFLSEPLILLVFASSPSLRNCWAIIWRQLGFWKLMKFLKCFEVFYFLETPICPIIISESF